MRVVLAEVWRSPGGRNKPSWFVGCVFISADLLNMPFRKLKGYKVRAVATAVTKDADYPSVRMKYLSEMKRRWQSRFS